MIVGMVNGDEGVMNEARTPVPHVLNKRLGEYGEGVRASFMTPSFHMRGMIW